MRISEINRFKQQFLVRISNVIGSEIYSFSGFYNGICVKI